MSSFADSRASHEHSLMVLNQLQEYDEFMESIQTLVDLGCGSALDLEWWATRMTREDNPQPLNIKCTGVDLIDTPELIKKYNNITYRQSNFEEIVHSSKERKFDVLWSHDSFQYAINPVQTLSNWWHIANDGAMLVLMVPQTTNMHRNKIAYTQESGAYYHYSIVSLIHMLAVNGWDCKSGFFLKNPLDPWLYAIVYKSEHKPMDPRTTTWHDLSALKLLPDSAEKSVYAHGELYQHELVLPWLDQGLRDLGQL